MYNDLYYSQELLHKSILKTFIYMALALIVTAATSYMCFASGVFLWMIYRIPMLPLILTFVQFGLMFAFSASMQKASAFRMKVLFFVFAITMGITSTALLFAFDFTTMALAFMISAVYFICLAFIGFTTKKDLTSLGTICLVGLVVMVFSQLIMMLFHIDMSIRLFSIIGLLLFTGITAWDMQRMNRLLIMNNGDMVTLDKISIFMALELYLDFLNIFIYILRLLQRNSD